MSPSHSLSRQALRFDPFTRGAPLDACLLTARVEHFCRRVSIQARSGGFCLVSGDPGVGKSVALRQLHRAMADIPDVACAILIRPQASIPDMYRELGEHFGVELRPSNRWLGTKGLRQRWREQFDGSLHRPLLLVDEAQEMRADVLNELRLLTTGELDSNALLTVVLAGDSRLDQHLTKPDLLPLASRIRVKLALGPREPEELAMYLRHGLTAAGNPALMTPELIDVLAQHAAGNLRALMHLASDLLELAVEEDLGELDEEHYLALAGAAHAGEPAKPKRKRRRAR